MSEKKRVAAPLSKAKPSGSSSSPMHSPHNGQPKSPSATVAPLDSDVLSGEFKATTQYGKTGSEMVAKKLMREGRELKLTKKEEEDSIGDWLFGVGGIRGLR